MCEKVKILEKNYYSGFRLLYDRWRVENEKIFSLAYYVPYTGFPLVGPNYKNPQHERQLIRDCVITITVVTKKVVLSYLSTDSSRGITVAEVMEASVP